MSPRDAHSAATPILSITIRYEGDIVHARQRTRQVAALAGFGSQDQVGLATAVSEISRNAFQYAGGGRLEFRIELAARPQFFWVSVTDQGAGIRDVDAILDGTYVSPTGMGIGISGTRRLTDRFVLTSEPGKGTCVRFGKALPESAPVLKAGDLRRIGGELTKPSEPRIQDEFGKQNQELLQAFEALQARDQEIERWRGEMARLRAELDETNRGVVALYAELDEKNLALRRADEVKSQFLSYVSHEFRTPANSIMALTQLLLRRTDGELTEEQEKQVRYIRKAAEALAEMVNDLLDLAKVEAGKTEIRAGDVDVSQVFGAVRALMRPLATKDAVTLVFDEPAAGLVIETDEAKLGQILRNLVSNALKFTEQGEVRVSCRLSDDRRSILFSVADTGIGIAPQYLERVFQEFAQVENPLQRTVKGTGLGLALSRKLAWLLGGTLQVASRLGIGSTFTLTLPARLRTGASEAENSEIVRAETAPGKILIVDDEETARYLCRQLFRGTKYGIIEAENASEGAERARFERPVLIILDLMMPDRNGFDVLDELKADPATADIPVVIHTSKRLTEGDLERLARRHAALLPKAQGTRAEVLLLIRSLLGEPDLFSKEPEFLPQELGRL